jgi:hypothetical protein
MSAKIVKSISRSLPLISAALILQTGAAIAAPPAADMHEQIRNLLAGKSANPPAALTEKRDDSAVGLPADVQEQTRRVLLGVADSNVHGTQVAVGRADASPSENAARINEAIHRKVELIDDDTQTMAQHVLLGDRNAAAAGS